MNTHFWSPIGLRSTSTQDTNMRSQFWMEVLVDLKDSGNFSGSHQHKCLLRFAFLELMQKDLNEFKDLWNQHRIRPSRMSACPSGIPSEIFSLPHRFQSRNFGYVVSEEKLRQLATQCKEICNCGDETIQEYLDFIKQQYNLQTPLTWRSAVELFLRLKEICNT
ncbi:uncharacterized protein LOC120528585 isoform X2 [Polypterus senegalus]|uniref:uncharacterized protein LOC120528585 isoform X2 n=1 Tax=Polypterus senegalus TaxID=55291 RepID=UPI0019634F88|nr:uncharacterized protein LOC120528585 isoform X2 [Polypterus senegalus]XP_039608698.1 uncharacterized protein LOC120528585 isoform X2 [Polypterus senegalus]